MAYLIPQELYGVVGWPLGQSLSPLLHNTGFQALCLPAAYLAWPLPPEKLSAFVENMGAFKVRGLSVTIPHKQTIMPFLDRVSDAAKLAGAVNTLYWDGSSLCGDNTDVIGFMSPLTKLSLPEMDILLLGAGGAAHAVCAGLHMARCHRVRITSPGDKRQYSLAERFGFGAVPWEERYEYEAQLLINATPAGMYGHGEAETPYDFSRGAKVAHAWAYDLVYNPIRTRFLREAEEAGRQCLSGLGMFLEQGAAQFRLWTGRDLPQEARDAVKRSLKANGQQPLPPLERQAPRA